MYTGIIDHCGEIIKIETRTQGVHLWIQSDFSDFSEGESIALDGICVTALLSNNSGVFECDLSPETLALTTAGSFQLGQQINLERSLTLSDRMGGHFVMGHVDTTAHVDQIDEFDTFVKMHLNDLTTESMRYLSKKGSVSVNGISLTINAIGKTGFSIMVIPHTLARTNLKNIRQGDRVNIEFDTIARIIVHQLEQRELS